MKVVILAGGFGTRLSEETTIKPKPMVEIGGNPILWHIMKHYSYYGFNEFIICLGYKGYIIKEYFANYFLHRSDVTFDLRSDTTHIHLTNAEPWKVTLVDTGVKSMTGGRIKRVARYIGNESFLMTYGDGVSNVNLNDLVKFHFKRGKYVTVTAVKPAGRFGALELRDDHNVVSFLEKPQGDGNWINGGFFVLEPQVFDYIENDASIFEQQPLKNLANDSQLNAYKHYGFWQPMDTLRDKLVLEDLWLDGNPAWKVWE